MTEQQQALLDKVLAVSCKLSAVTSADLPFDFALRSGF
jgi:hypothetical protein